MNITSWFLGLLFTAFTVITPLVWMALKNKNTIIEGWKRT
jgi:predicted outer membrane lipoprotein